MPDGLNYESTHIQMTYIFIFLYNSQTSDPKRSKWIRRYFFQTFTRHKPAPCFKQNSLRMYTDMHRYAIFTNITNNIIV